MCIALFSTAHPQYALIVISNRDEYLQRPTAPAAWWDAPHSHVLGGRDLQRSERGTWLGVTRDGRIATLTNFREDTPAAEGSVSRGAMVNAYLKQAPASGGAQEGGAQESGAQGGPASASATDAATESFARGLISGSGARGTGGFTLVVGRAGRGLAVVSNRMAGEDEVAWLAGARGQTVGLSNAAFADRSWPKVTMGETWLREAVERDVKRREEGGGGGDGVKEEEVFVEDLLALLSRDTLPVRQDGEGWATYVNTLKESVFIPVVGGEDATYYGDEIASGKSGRRMSVNRLAPGSYGTSKQSVVLVDFEGNVTFVERTLYEDAMAVPPEEGTRTFRFKVDESA